MEVIERQIWGGGVQERRDLLLGARIILAGSSLTNLYNIRWLIVHSKQTHQIQNCYKLYRCNIARNLFSNLVGLKFHLYQIMLLSNMYFSTRLDISIDSIKLKLIRFYWLIASCFNPLSDVWHLTSRKLVTYINLLLLRVYILIINSMMNFCFSWRRS